MENQNSGLGLFCGLFCVLPILWGAGMFFLGRWTRGLRVRDAIQTMRRRDL